MSGTNGTTGPLAAKKRLLRNPTRAYRPSGGGAWGFSSAVLDGQPFFTWLDIPRMLRDPRVRLTERMWRAPFQRVKWRVKADNPKVARFVDATLRRFWRGSLPKLLSRYFRYGYAPGGAELVPRKGYIRLDRVRSVEPRDAQPRVWARGRLRGEPAGFTLSPNQAAAGAWVRPPDSAPARWVAPPHAFWFAGYGEFGPWFDLPPMSGMWEPWVEKRGRGGAVHARRFWFRKCAFRGGVIHHPPGTCNMGTEENPRVMDNQDVARSTLEYAESTTVFTFTNEVNPGNPALYAWDYEEPEAQADVSGVREYPQDLDGEMLEGVGIPPEVLEASDVGSGWSGRLIPLMGFLGGVDELAGMVIDSADGWMRPLVRANFGPAWYEVEPQSLAEEVQTQAKSGKGGAPENGRPDSNPFPGLFGGGEGGRPGQPGQPPGAGPRPQPGQPRPTADPRQRQRQRQQPRQMSDWDESRVKRDAGRFATHEGAGAVSGAAPEPPHEDSKARRVVRMLANLPKKAVKKARKKVADAYAKLESRYGPGYAKVIVGAAVAGLPVPIPGTTVLLTAPILAVAELHRRLSKWASPPPERLDEEGVVKPAARWFLSRVFGRLRGALHLSMFDPLPFAEEIPDAVELSAWNPDDHPRGDDGRFVDAHDLHAAMTDPAKAAELRAKVTKPAERAKLDAAIGTEKPEAPDLPDGVEVRRNPPDSDDEWGVYVEGEKFPATGGDSPEKALENAKKIAARSGQSVAEWLGPRVRQKRDKKQRGADERAQKRGETFQIGDKTLTRPEMIAAQKEFLGQEGGTDRYERQLPKVGQRVRKLAHVGMASMGSSGVPGMEGVLEVEPDGLHVVRVDKIFNGGVRGVKAGDKIPYKGDWSLHWEEQDAAVPAPPSAETPATPAPVPKPARKPRAKKPAPDAKPAPAPAPQSPPVKLDDPHALAAAVHAAGRTLASFTGQAYSPGEGAWYRHKVTVIDLYDAMAAAGTLPHGTTLDEFKAALMAAHLADTLDLGRNDLPQIAADAERMIRGTVHHPAGVGEYHVVNVPHRRPVEMSATHAPAGYTKDRPLVVGGKSFTGGEFIPGDVLAKATPEEKAKLGGGGAGKAAPGKADEEAKPPDRVSVEELKAAQARARAKARANPPPTRDEVRLNRAGMAKLGANKFRKNLVGNSTDRFRRREILLKEFGDGEQCPCVYCGIRLRHGTLEQDKIYTTAEGGRYRTPNLVPACSGCNKVRGDTSWTEIKWPRG